MCCDPYKIERVLDRLWKDKKCYIDRNKPEDILIEMPFEGDIKNISLRLTSLHSKLLITFCKYCIAKTLRIVI